MRISILIVVILLPMIASAQRVLSTDVWHAGYLLTDREEKLEGLIKYDLETGVVQFRKNDDLAKAFTAKNLVFFQIEDKVRNLVRRFYSLPYELDGNYESLVLFEVLLEGPLTLLSIEKKETVIRNYYYWGMVYNYGEIVLKPHFYLLMEGKEILPFNGKKKQLFDLLEPRDKALREYISEENLRTDDLNDLIRIINHYNRLFNGK